MSENLIEVKKLVTQFSGKNGTVTAVDGVSFNIKKGETLGIVGESGCGKSVTSMSILRLIPPQSGKIASGEILFGGKDLTKLSDKEIRQIRGNEIAMIFQDSMTGLNPVMTIGKQLVETITAHSKMDKKEAWERAREMLMKVGIPSPAQRLKEYPHQLSGGMRQRVMIAMALSCNAALFIADEPTTALDVTIQAQILKLIKDLQKEYNYTIVFITHDLGVVANIADRVAVLYAGQIIEFANVEELFYDPRHPYTWALLSSLPQLAERNTKLFSITGTPPSLYNKIIGDPFAPRNQYCLKIDTLEEPPMFKVTDTHYAKTWLLDPRAPKTEKPEAIQNIHEKLLKAYNL